VSSTMTDDRAESLRMVRDSAAAVIPADGGFGRVRRLRYTMPGFEPAVWAEMGALGWIGLRLPEEAGGIGLGMSEACALYEELGGALVPEPLIAGALSARVLAAVGETELLSGLLAGTKLVLTAWQQDPGVLDVPGSPGAPRCFLPMAAGAEAFLVPFRQDGKLTVRLLKSGSAALEMSETQDGGHYGMLRPDALAGQTLGGDATDALATALDEAALGTAAYLLGAMERAFAMTLGYLRDRHQFGKPLGSFQALQHRAADLKIQLALTRASVEDAAAKLDQGAAGAARQAVVSRAKTRAAEAALRVTREAVQMHGAIGYTDEHDVGLFLRKAMVVANQFGSAAFHRARFMRYHAATQD